MFTTVCPGCEASLNAPDTLKGKKVKCKKCGEPFVARPAVEADDEERPLPKTVKMASPGPAKPRRKSSDEDEPTEEAPPLKGKKAGKRRTDEDTEVMDSAGDDEPRPKKKKGKSKKKEGSPMMLVLIVVGAVVLLGGGAVGAYYAFFNGGDKGTTPSAKGGTTTESTPPKTAAADTSAWVEMHEPDGAYRVKFPAQPTARTEREQTPWGQLDIKTHNLMKPPEVFVTAHFPVEDRMGLTEEQILDGVVKLVTEEGKGSVVKNTRLIKYQSFNGREVTVDIPGKKGSAVMRRTTRWKPRDHPRRRRRKRDCRFAAREGVF